jgi:PAS domain S-box-containing protein
MTNMPIAAALMLALLLGLAAALVVLLRVERRVRATLRQLRDAAPAGGRDVTVQPDAVLDDLHRTSEAFDDMNARFRAQAAVLDQACELAGLGTWVLLPDLQSVRISSHMGRIMGVPDDDEVVRIDALRERILPEDRAAFEDALKSAIQTRRMTEVEFRARDAVGDTRIFRARTGPGGAVPEDREGVISGVIQDITGIRHNETELARSLRLEHQAGEAARIGGWTYEIATRTLRTTQETSDLVGAEREQTLDIEDVIARFEDADERTRMERGFWTCVGAGTRFDESAGFRRLDGTETRLRVIGEAERDATGTIIGVYGTLQDVGELTLAKSASAAFRTLLGATLDALTDGFVICDGDGRIAHMNRRAHVLLGVADQNLVGRDIRQALPDGIDPQVEHAVKDALVAGDNRNFESEISAPGQWVDVTVRATPAGVAIYLEDVTETRASRARLRLLDAAVGQIDDVVLITDATGPRVVFGNEAFTRMTGYAPDEILDATPRILQGPGTERDRLDEIAEAIAARRPLRTELTNYRKDGSRFTVELDILPLFDAAGTCTHFASDGVDAPGGIKVCQVSGC